MDLKIYLLFLIGSYIAGSINFSIIIFSLLKKGDPREQFSGNAGVTNVYRQAGIFWAGLVLILDMGRSLAAAFAATSFLPAGYISWTGLALLIGNRFPLFHGLRGGKGVANYLGFAGFINPYMAFASAQIWVISYFMSKEPFISSFIMISVLAFGVINITGFNILETAGSIVTVVFIIINHKKNIQEYMKEI